MSTELTNNELNEQEQQFLYNLEVLGMPQIRAAELAGYTTSSYAYVLKKPAFVLAREKMKEQLRQSSQITREEVLAGYKEAIDRARILDEPMSMIAGWTAISKILGYDKPQEVHITVSGGSDIRKQIRSLSERELLKLVDDSGVIDGEFYPID